MPTWFHQFLEATKEYGFITAILVFVATQLISFFWRQRDTNLKKSRIRSGLHYETLQNINTAERTALNEQVIAQLKDLIEADNKYRPLITITFQSVFYDSVAGDLPMLLTEEMKAINNFHYSATQLLAAVDALKDPAYFIISANGRKGLIDDIWASFQETRDNCVKAEEKLRARAA